MYIIYVNIVKCKNWMYLYLLYNNDLSFKIMKKDMHLSSASLRAKKQLRRNIIFHDEISKTCFYIFVKKKIG